MALTEALQAHHKHCDELFALAEDAALGNNWQACNDKFVRFRRELEAHFDTEEQVLFPAFEAATGSSGGPPQVMRFEHQQMRDLISGLAGASVARDREAFAGLAETLLVLMQQHNMKEEHILYPMCDRMVAGVSVADELHRRIA
jgi:iron-sulfur cluster repair protein YtfE (RIC family)